MTNYGMSIANSINCGILAPLWGRDFFFFFFFPPPVLRAASGRYRKHMRRNVDTCWPSILKNSLRMQGASLSLYSPLPLVCRVAFNAVLFCNFRHRVRILRTFDHRGPPASRHARLWSRNAGFNLCPRLFILPILPASYNSVFNSVFINFH